MNEYERLRAWIRDYGAEKQPAFIADLTKILDDWWEWHAKPEHFKECRAAEDSTYRGEVVDFRPS